MALSRLAVKRLTKLADFMESVPRHRFSMERWFWHKGRHSHLIGPTVTRKALEHCETTACALGWAATIPLFRRAGLAIQTNLGGTEAPLLGATDVFDIDYSAARELFYSDIEKIKTPKQWAKHCRRFIRENT